MPHSSLRLNQGLRSLTLRIFNNVGQNRRSRHARGRFRRLHLLHHLDPSHALCRRRSPSPKLLSSSRLGHSHPRHYHPSRFRCCWLLPEHGHDSEQPEEGCKGQGCR
ncbi:unnamed protein product [Fusarium graminearum]|nr:unnamed protein product [Fusarium graminearum]